MNIVKLDENTLNLIFNGYTFRIGKYRTNWQLGSIPHANDWTSEGLEFYANCLMQVSAKLKELNHE